MKVANLVYGIIIILVVGFLIWYITLPYKSPCKVENNKKVSFDDEPLMIVDGTFYYENDQWHLQVGNKRYPLLFTTNPPQLYENVTFRVVGYLLRSPSYDTIQVVRIENVRPEGTDDD